LAALVAARLQTNAAQHTVLRFAIHRVGVARVGLAVKAVAAADAAPVRRGDAVIVVGGAGAAPAAGVLHAAVDAVGPAHVHAHPVKLCDGQAAADRLPGPALVLGDVQAAVVAQHEVVGVLGVDPQGVVVGVAGVGPGEGLAAVAGGAELDVQQVHPLVVVGV